jgi:hypothetical protein
MEKKPSDILSEAADALEKGDVLKWGRGSFFMPILFTDNDVKCQACAHGAIAYTGCKSVREAIGLHLLATPPAFSLAHGAAKNNRSAPSHEAQVNSIYGPEETASSLAHYFAFRVGLSIIKNDYAGNKSVVIALLRQAAKLALTEGY